MINPAEIRDKEMEHENMLNPSSLKGLISDTKVPLGKFNQPEQELELDDIVKLTYDQLYNCTHGFSDDNYIVESRFGKFCRGKIVEPQFTKDVVLKMCTTKIDSIGYGNLVDEITFLLWANHDGIPKLYGYCLDFDRLGIVYDYNPYDFLHNLIENDDFTWMQRIKVALQLAYIFKHLHGRKCSSYTPFVIRSLSSECIMVDKDYNIKLCDFSIIVGGIFPDADKYDGRSGITYGWHETHPEKGDYWASKHDVFAFGILLLALISKNDNLWNCWYSAPKVDVHTWADLNVDYRECWKSDDNTDSDLILPKICLSHGSFEDETDFDLMDGQKITRLAMECVKVEEQHRPSMRLVIKHLRKLRVVKKNVVYFGMEDCYKPS